MIEVHYLGHYGSDLDVVNAARVSFDAESEMEYRCDCGNTLKEGNCGSTACYFTPRLTERDAKLIDYLAREKHKSPFNHAWVKFRVIMPIFTARQLVKHEYLPWNEVSRRYVEGDLDWYFPEDDDWRTQPANTKQGSGDAFAPGSMEQRECRRLAIMAVAQAEASYNRMISLGLSREQARMFLPQNLMTTVIWSGTLYAFAKMASLRTDDHAQREAAYAAQPILDTLKELFPVSTEALLRHGVS